MTLLLCAVLSFLLVLIATAIYLPVARRLRILDTPNHRSAHQLATPSSGGVALVAGLLSALAASAFAGLWLPQKDAFAMSGGLLMVCIIGALDDRQSLSVQLRLSLFLFLSLAIAVYFLHGSGVSHFWIPLLALAFAWLLNLYNFMDGIDGLAALQCALVAGGMLFLGSHAGGPTAFLAVSAAVAGAYAAFLVFNWPPARLFMGDAGSLSAGLLLGWLGLWAWRDQILPAGVWLLLMSPFLLDTGITLAVRAIRRERLTDAHRGHLYQRLLRHWGSARRVDYALLILQFFWLLPLAFLVCLGVTSQWTLVAIGLFPQLLLIAKYRRLT